MTLNWIDSQQSAFTDAILARAPVDVRSRAECRTSKGIIKCDEALPSSSNVSSLWDHVHVQPHMVCVRTQNRTHTWSCACVPGFVMTYDGCMDLNECSLDVHTCPNTQICMNHIGSYTCMQTQTQAKTQYHAPQQRIRRSSADMSHHDNNQPRPRLATTPLLYGAAVLCAVTLTLAMCACKDDGIDHSPELELNANPIYGTPQGQIVMSSEPSSAGSAAMNDYLQSADVLHSQPIAAAGNMYDHVDDDKPQLYEQLSGDHSPSHQPASSMYSSLSRPTSSSALATAPAGPPILGFVASCDRQRATDLLTGKTDAVFLVRAHSVDYCVSSIVSGNIRHTQLKRTGGLWNLGKVEIAPASMPIQEVIRIMMRKSPRIDLFGFFPATPIQL